MKNLIDTNAIKSMLEELMELEQDRFIIRFHQNVQKYQQKAWNDRKRIRKEF